MNKQDFRQDIFVKEYKGAKEVKVEDLYDGIDVFFCATERLKKMEKSIVKHVPEEQKDNLKKC